MSRIILIILLLLKNGYTIEYNHIPNFPDGYYTIYFNGECVADDIQFEDIYDYFK